MTDTSEQAPVEEAPVEDPVQAEIQAAIDAVRAQTAAKAEAQALAASSEEARIAKLDAVKARAQAVTDPIAKAYFEAEDPAEKAALGELLNRKHAEFGDELARAYQEFSGMRDGDSNPVPEGGTGQLEAAIHVFGDTSADTVEG